MDINMVVRMHAVRKCMFVRVYVCVCVWIYIETTKEYNKLKRSSGIARIRAETCVPWVIQP